MYRFLTSHDNSLAILMAVVIIWIAYALINVNSSALWVMAFTLNPMLGFVTGANLGNVLEDIVKSCMKKR